MGHVTSCLSLWPIVPVVLWCVLSLYNVNKFIITSSSGGTRSHQFFPPCLQVYHAIGEQFSNSTDIVGVALNLRKTGPRIAVWTRGSQDVEDLKQLGREFKALVQMPASKTIGFARHEDSKRQNKFFWSGFTGDIVV
jgi:hypothetical protein